jgi:hypothetical protein
VQQVLIFGSWAVWYDGFEGPPPAVLAHDAARHATTALAGAPGLAHDELEYPENPAETIETDEANRPSPMPAT